MATNPARSKLLLVETAAQDRIPEVLGGGTPDDFHWIMFEVDTSKLTQVKSAEGLAVDMRDALSTLSFSQVYPGPCNPARDQFERCLLYERLDAGGTGVVGRIQLRLGATLDASYDVSVEGLTDRFGDPVQWHKHGSTGDVSARIAGVP